MTEGEDSDLRVFRYVYILQILLENKAKRSGKYLRKSRNKNKRNIYENNIEKELKSKYI